MSARIVLLLLLLPLSGGCAGPGGSESAEVSRQAAAEAVRIKAALLAEPDLAGSAIEVSFDDGRVTLEGFVETDEQRSRATALAGKQPGVEQVVNEIVVK